MNDPVELCCTPDDDGTWLVWFPHPLGGHEVIGQFDTEAEARAFWQEQIDSADWSA